MVIQFGVSNFLCYANPTVLQFSTNAKETLFKEDIVGNRFYRCLKYAALFGSNASGKSSFIKAVDYFVACVKDNRFLSAAHDKYTRTRKENKSNPSLFEIVLLINDTFYQYGFEIILSSGRVINEYIYKITPSTQSRTTIFDRSEKVFNIKSKKNTSNDIQTRINDSIVRNSLFLTNIGSLLKRNPDEELDIIREIYSYITERIIIINKNVQSNYMFISPVIGKDFTQILNEFDFNIESIEKKPIDWNLFSSQLAPNILQDIKNDFVTNDRNAIRQLLIGNALYLINLVNDDIVVKRIIFKHFNNSNDFDYNEESDGTLRIMDFIPIFLMKKSATFFIDEIEASLSSDAVVHFFQMLREKNNDVQIMFTTHTDRLFDKSMFRRDELYIVEKDLNGESMLKRMNQFSGIYEENRMNQKFISGLYGGRPRILNRK